VARGAGIEVADGDFGAPPPRRVITDLKRGTVPIAVPRGGVADAAVAVPRGSNTEMTGVAESRGRVIEAAGTTALRGRDTGASIGGGTKTSGTTVSRGGVTAP
jgi:hypothetical protein